MADPTCIALAELPRCPTCGTHMMLRKAGTREQDFCGTWYECGEPRCVNAVLIPSAELIKNLEEVNGGKKQ